MPIGLPAEAATLRKHSTWFIIYGLIIIALGVFAIASVILVGAFWIAATTHRTTQAAAPPMPPAVVQPVSAVETMRIVPAEDAEARRGRDALHSTNRTDW